MKIKKGDKVIVIAGKEKSKTTTVSKALPAQNKVILDGLNKMKKAVKPKKQGDKGGIIEVSMPINVSNVKLAEKASKPAKKEKKTK